MLAAHAVMGTRGAKYLGRGCWGSDGEVSLKLQPATWPASTVCALIITIVA